MKVYNGMFGEYRWKQIAKTNISSQKENIFLTVTKNKFIAWNYIFSGATGIYLFEYSKLKWGICSKLTKKAPIECNLAKIWKTHPPRCRKNAFPEVFCILSFLHLISNGVSGVNVTSLTQIVALLKIFE